MSKATNSKGPNGGKTFQQRLVSVIWTNFSAQFALQNINMHVLQHVRPVVLLPECIVHSPCLRVSRSGIECGKYLRFSKEINAFIPSRDEPAILLNSCVYATKVDTEPMVSI